MSYNISWIAIEGCSREEALRLLRLEPVRECAADDPPKCGVATLPDGKLLLLGDWHDALDESYIHLTRGRRGVGCCEYETVMYSQVVGLADGQVVWDVVHDPETSGSLSHLKVEGAPPAPFEAIRDEEIARQAVEGGDEADTDYIFEIPPRLAQALVGYRYCELSGVVFTELRRAGRRQPPKAGWLARLFGGR